MPQTRTGGCLCGHTRYSFAGEAKFAIRCFCRDCQRISGGGHLPQLAVARADVAFTGPLKTYPSTAESGSALELGFCGDCGSPLFKTTSRAPDLTFLTAGSLDDPSAYEPGKDVLESGRQDWDKG